MITNIVQVKSSNYFIYVDFEANEKVTGKDIDEIILSRFRRLCKCYLTKQSNL